MRFLHFPNFNRKPTPTRPIPIPHLAPAYRHLTFRQWEASVMLFNMTGAVRERLWTWLTATQRPYGWADAPLARDRPAFSDTFLNDGAVTVLREALWKELLASQQTLNLPLHILGGPTRNKLLMQHGIRLRQVLQALEKKTDGLPADEEVRLMLRWL